MNTPQVIYDFLISSLGKEVLKEVNHIGEIAHFSPPQMTLLSRKKLKNIDATLLNICIEISCCREKLKQEYPWAIEGFFTQQGVEQKTSLHISEHHAQGFSGCSKLCEIGTGLGFDTQSFSKKVKNVVSFDTDLLTVLFARHNLSVQGINNVEVIHGDGCTEDLSSYDSLFSDPSRRTNNGERIKDPEKYSPPLSVVIAKAESKIFGIKVSPIVIPPKNFSGALEWIGDSDDLKELVLWGGRGIFKQVTIPGQSFSYTQGAEKPKYLSEIPEPPFFLVEPHASIIGSILYPYFFATKGISTFESGVAYGVSIDEIVSAPYWKRFRIEEVMPLRVPDIIKRAQSLDLGRESEVKKRGIEIDPNEIQKKLSKNGKNKKVLFLTRFGEKKVCLIGERI